MPGIMGIITKHPRGDEEGRLQTMMASMAYEPFYRQGTYCDKARGFFVGFTAFEGSFADCMPVFNETKTLALFLTGEVYPDESVRSALKQRGHSFASDDASYLVHLFEEDPNGFLASLNGSFNGLILDLPGERAILFNDRYGVRRVYFAEVDSGLAFSAEAKALLKAYPALRQLSPKGVGEYLVYDCVFEDRTLFEGIRLLPPGSAWTIGKGEIDKQRYHDPRPPENQSLLTPGEFTDRFIETFERIVPRYFSGRPSVGLGLTGGLDTRCILAARHPAPRQLPCYTYRFKSRNTYDVRIAPLVAEASGQSHTFLELDENDYLKNYPEIVTQMIYASDGLGSAEQADLFCFNRMSREVAPVRMSGKYGTEVLKNGRGLKGEAAPREGLIREEFRPFLAAARETYRTLPPFTDFSFYLYKDLPWWWNKYIAIESTQVEVRSPYLDNDLIRLVHQAPPMSTPARERMELTLIGRLYPSLLKVPSTSFHREAESFPRRSFKRARLVGEKIYTRERVPHGMTHAVAKIDRLLKPLHLERRMTGWIPRNNRVIFRDGLAPFLKETLLSPKTFGRPYWDRGFLEGVTRAHTTGKGNYLRELRKVLQIELIARTFID
jgi:asparagine synthase (glutamine-hydrolysing)